MDKTLLAPCGMNCAVCIGYQRDKKKCSGCRASGGSQPLHCQKCNYKHCDEIKDNHLTFCYECVKFPCARLKAFDKRYRKWGLSLIQNLNDIKILGEKQFLKNETIKWTCDCGALLCAHESRCLKCGAEKEERMK